MAKRYRRSAYCPRCGKMYRKKFVSQKWCMTVKCWRKHPQENNLIDMKGIEGLSYGTPEMDPFGEGRYLNA